MTVIKGSHDTGVYYDAVAGHENDAEGGERCKICFELRLNEAAKYAKENGFDYFTTTLSISPLKDAELLNAIGNKMSEGYRHAGWRSHADAAYIALSLP